MTDLAALVVRMQADNSQYIKALDQATAKLSKFSKDQSDLLGDLAAKFAAAFTIDKLVGFTEASIEAEASLAHLSESAGISVESLSALRLAAAASGIGQEELGSAFKKLNVNIAQAAGDANSKAGAAFHAMGISVKDLSGNVKTADVVLGEMANKFQGYADGPNKTAIAYAILGRNVGDKMIPVLNEGAAGLEEFRKKAEAAGLVLSGQAADAAKEFAQKAAVLKATLIDGLGIQLTAQLLPALNKLVDAFNDSGVSSDIVATAATQIATAFKLVGTVAIGIITQVENFGRSIGNLAAAAVAAASGDVLGAANILKEGLADNINANLKAADLITALWHEQTAQELKDAKDKYDKKAALAAGRKEAPNVTEESVGSKAIKELEKFNAGILTQVQAFGLGGAALVDYKLKYGPLADAIEHAGKKGQELAAQIRANATELQTKQDTKAVTDANDAIIKQIALHGQGAIAAAEFESRTGKLGEEFKRLGAAGEQDRLAFVALKTTLANLTDDAAITALDNKMKQLAGDTVAATKAAFDLQHHDLRQDKKDDPAALATIDAAEKQAMWQAQINDLNTKAGEIKTDLSVIEEKLAAQHAVHQINDIEYENQLAAARAAALVQLQSIGGAEQQVADAAGTTNIALVDGVKKFQASLVTLQAQTTQLENSVRSGLETAFGDNFSKLISGAESFRQAMKSFFLDIEKQLDQLVSKNLAQSIFGLGGPAGGAAGGIAGLFGGGSIFGSLFASSSGAGAAAATAGGIGEDATSTLAGLGFAAGGTIGSGKYGVVGENGPELAYAGSKDLHIQPMSSAKQAPSITNHFVIAAPGGTISRASQMQTAAAAARSISQANRRNNS
jgi:hypothetical protein